MKFPFFLLMINILLPYKPLESWRCFSDKRDGSVSADAVSRMATSLAAQASNDAKEKIKNKIFEACSKRFMPPPRTYLMNQEVAEKSEEAAKIAECGLANKINLVNKLQKEKRAVKSLLHGLIHSKKELEDAINKEIEALATAATLKEILDKALQIASQVAVNADIVLDKIKGDIQTVDKILRIENRQSKILRDEERCATKDVEETKIAEKKAVASATHAKQNALRS